MCGRFTLRTPLSEVAEAFDLPPQAFEHGGGWPLRYNVAPSLEVTAVRHHEAGGREAAWLRWGLIPPWAEDPTVGMINARSETADAKPAFREAFRRRRCLVAADGFYEWKHGSKPKQPYYIRLADDGPFAFAGLWERWRRGEQEIQSCTILTTEPNELVRALHDRMPVILDPRHYDAWLDPNEEDPVRLAPLLVPYPAERMTIYPVSSKVNSTRNDGPDLIARAAPGKTQGSLFD